MDDYERRTALLKQNTTHHHVVSQKTIMDDTNNKPKSTLGFRFILCILGFICYILFDYGKMSVSNIDSQVVRNQIEKQWDLQSILPSGINL